MTHQALCKVITPLVRRHAEDAAFYWNQHDTCASSTQLGLPGLSKLSHLLAAHLEGLTVAGADAWQLCNGALERWRKPAEAFVCAYVALTLADTAYIDALLKSVRAHPDQLLRGVVSALAWLPVTDACRMIAQWTGTTSDSVMQVAALRAIAVIGRDAALVMAQPLTAFLTDPDHYVRAAACRAACVVPDGAGPGEGVDAALEALLEDPVAAVRAEAAIALGSRNHSGQVRHSAARPFLPVLWQCAIAQAEISNSATGWHRMQAQRRLERWVQQLALLHIPGEECRAALDVLPARVRLRFIACQGDPVHLPLVVDHMDIPGLERYAGWVWQTMTGVDLAGSGMSLPEPEPDKPAPLVTELGNDADFGLSYPDVAAVRRYPLSGLAHGQRYIGGVLLTPSYARDLLVNAPQAVRSVAADCVRQSYPGLCLSVRAGALVQRAHIARLDAMIAQEVPH